MRLEHSFSVPADVEEAWATLMDVERVAPCMPGATLTSRTDQEFSGQVRVKLGPISLTYAMTGHFREQDADAHRAVIEARGKENRGSGTAAATIELTLQPDGQGATRADVAIDLDITGRPAQFGRSTLADVSNTLVAEFASRLAATLADAPDAEAAHSDQPAASHRATPLSAPEPDALNLVKVVAVPMLRRSAPVLVSVAIATLLACSLRRSRRR